MKKREPVPLENDERRLKQRVTLSEFELDLLHLYKLMDRLCVFFFLELFPV